METKKKHFSQEKDQDVENKECILLKLTCFELLLEMKAL